MAKVLVLYPELFNCYSKFARKLDKIGKNLEEATLLYPNDENQLIQRYSGESSRIIDTVAVSDWSIDDITHAVVFDDGEEFPCETKLLESSKVPYRKISIKITRVVNIKKEARLHAKGDGPGYEYIGRNSYWGNPHSMFEDGRDREEVIRMFRYDFEYDKFPNKDVSKVYGLAGKRLGCFCKPQSCHGDILADFLNSWDDGK